MKMKHRKIIVDLMNQAILVGFNQHGPIFTSDYDIMVVHGVKDVMSFDDEPQAQDMKHRLSMLLHLDDLCVVDVESASDRPGVADLARGGMQHMTDVLLFNTESPTFLTH